MAEKRDYYEVLGVDKNADDSAIKRAYRKLAKQYHPDSNPGDESAAEKFREASEAYAVLSDPEKRKAYDMAMRPLMRIPLREQAPVLAVLISAAWIWEIFSPSFSGEASVPPTVLPAEDPICRKREPIFV